MHLEPCECLSKRPLPVTADSKSAQDLAGLEAARHVYAGRRTTGASVKISGLSLTQSSCCHSSMLVSPCCIFSVSILQSSHGRSSNFGTAQVIVIPNLSISVTKDEAYQIIIVPTGAVGASSVKREYPQNISFSWPDKMADKELHSHEAANPEKDTYLSVFVKAMNDHLKPFNKAVIDLTPGTGSESAIERTAILSPPTDSRVKAKTRGTDTNSHDLCV